MKTIDKIVNRLTGVVSIISYASFFFIMVFTVLDVFLRYTFNNPILGSYEVVERAVFCGVFAAFAYAQTQKSHIHITMLVGLFPQKVRLVLSFLTGLLSTAAALLIAYAATLQAGTAFASNYTTAVLKIVLYPFYWIEFAAMLVFGLVLFYDALKNLIAVFSKQVAAEVTAEW